MAIGQIPEFTPDSGEWFTKDQMRKALGFGDPNTVDNWRRKLGKKYEHSENRGDHRGVWLYAPRWIAAYFAAQQSPDAGADPSGGLTPKQRRETANARRAEIEVTQLERELDANWLHRDVAMTSYRAIGQILKAHGGQMCPTCKRHLNDGLSEIQHQFAGVNGSAAGSRNGTGTRLAESTPQPSRIR